MSKSVDERVVEMRFNNKQFEEGIDESIKSLENLKKSLKLEDASKGLKNVQDAGKNFNLSTVTDALEAVTNKFSVLGTIGDQVIRNLVNKFDEFKSKAIGLYKSLSTDQISAGWDKYQDKTQSVLTIMNATGKSIEDVEEQLGKLQWFTDETSYNFVDMTSNIAKFTNANVPLEDSVNAMMGIANWAAVSGANVNEASRAMYNLSQAMSMDQLNLLDWRSIENANMATMEFKQTAIDTALEFGYLKKEADGTIVTMQGTEVTAANLRNTLSDGWFSGKVIVETLKKYSDYTNAVYEVADAYDTCAQAMENVDGTGMDLGKKAFEAAQKYRTLKDALDATKDAVSSGWMETFQTIFGNMEEQTELWTALGNTLWEIFAKKAEGRNALLAEWKKGGGFEAIYNGVSNIYNAFKRLILYAKEGWRKVFPASTADKLIGISKAFERFTEKFRKWAESLSTAKSVMTIFQGIASAFQLIKKLVVALITPFKNLNKGVNDTGEGVLGLVAKFFNLFTKLNESEKLVNVFSGIGTVLSKVVGFIIKAISKFIDVIKNLKDYLAPLGGFFSRVWEGIKSVFQNVIAFFSPTADKIESASTKITRAIENTGSSKEKVKKKIEGIKSAYSPLIQIFETIVKVVKFAWSIIEKVSPIILSTVGKIAELINATIDALIRISNEISFDKIIAGGLTGGFLKTAWSFSGIAKEFKNVIKDFRKYISEFRKIFKAIGEGISDMSKTLQKNVKADILKKIAKAVLMLAAAVWILATIDTNKLLAAGGAVVLLMAELTGSSTILNNGSSKIDYKQVQSVSKTLTKMATAILVLALALKLIASLDSNQIKNGLIAIGGLMIEIVAAVKLLNKGMGDDNSKQLTKTGIGLNLIAFAIRNLAKTIRILAGISLADIGKGIAAIGALLLELGLFTNKLSGSKDMVSVGFALLEISVAVAILTKCINKLGNMQPGVLVTGLLSIGAAISGLSAAMKLVPDKMFAKALAFIMLAAALEIIADVVKRFGSMDVKTLAKGLIAVGVAMVGIAAAMKLIPKQGAMVSALSFTVMVLAIEMLLPALNAIGAMSWESIIKGVLTLGIAVVGIAAATKLLNGDVKSAAAFIIIATAIDMLALAFKVLGSIPLAGIVAGLVAMAGSLGLMVAAGYALKPVSANLAAVAASMLKMSIASVLFAAATLGMALALELLANVAKSSTRVLINALKMILFELPALLKILAASMKEALPSIATIIGSVVKVILTVIKENIPAIVETIFDTILQVLTTLATKAPAIIEQLFKFLVAIFDGLKTYIPIIVKDIMEMIRGIIEAVLEAFEGLSVGSVVKAIAGISAMSLVFTQLATLSIIGLATTGMLVLIAKNLNKFIEAIEPFLDKIQQVDSNSLTGAKALASTVLTLTEASILEALTKWFRGDSGGMVEFGQQIAQLGPYIAQYADSIKGVDTDAVLKSALAAETLANFANNLPKHGGFVQKITGENSILEFTQGLTEFGPALMAYDRSIVGLNAQSVVRSVNAAQTISAFADNLPKHGGYIQKITGDNSLTEFAQGLAVFGPNLKAYAMSVAGLDSEIVINSIHAAQAISEFATNLPNQGGVVSWFAGDNKLSVWADELAAFGPSLAKYAYSIRDINPQAIMASGYAARALFKIADEIPNQGGLIAGILGDNTLDVFAEGLLPFGRALGRYSKAVVDVNKEAVTRSADAAKAIFDVVDYIPNQGGFISLVVGDNTLGDFAEGLIPFGRALAIYSTAVKNVNRHSVSVSAKASKELFDVFGDLPNQGGVISWFVGDNKLGDIASGLVPYGWALKYYGESVKHLPNWAIKQSAETTKIFFETMALMPDQGGIKTWFVGDNTLSKFAKDLTKYGPALAEYGNSIEGVNVAKIYTSANATKSLFEIIDSMPDQGGIKTWFTGDNTLGKIAKDLVEFGPALKEYGESVADLKYMPIRASALATKALLDAVSEMPNQGGVVSWFTGDNTLGKIGEDLKVFGPAFKDYADSVSGLNVDDVIKSSDAVYSIISNINSIPLEGGLSTLWTGDNTLSQIGKDLEVFGPAFKKYADGVKGMDVDGVIDSGRAVYSIIGNINAIPLQGGLSTLWTGDNTLGTIGEDLKTFGPSFKEYADSVSGMDTEGVKASSRAFCTLVNTLNRIPNQGGIKTLWEGDNNLGRIGEDLKTFGPAFKIYGESVTGLNTEDIDSASMAILSLLDAFSSVPNIENFWTFWTDKTTLTRLAIDLAGFGPSFKDYGESVRNINVRDIEASGKALAALINAFSGIQNIENFWTFWSNRTTIGRFGGDIKFFGEALKYYSDTVVDLPFDKIKESARATKVVIDVLSSMPDQGGIKTWWEGDNTFERLGESLVAFGPALETYSKSIADIKSDKIKESAETVRAFLDTIGSIPITGGIKSLWTGDNSLGTLGHNIETLGYSLQQYYESVRSVQWFGVNDSIRTAHKFVELSEAVSEADFASLSGFAESITDMGNAGVTGFLEAFTGKYEEAIETGSKLVTNTSDGMTLKEDVIVTAAKGLANSIYDGVNSRTNDYYGIGVNIVKGVTAGISNSPERVASTTTAYNYGRAVCQSIADGAEVQSPSKATYETARFIIAGLVNGLTDYSGTAENAAETVSEDVLLAMEEALANVIEIMRSDGDFSPVIRPVIDLSEAKKQAGEVNGLFGSQAIGGTGFSIASKLNRTIQNGYNTGGVNTTTNNNSAAITFNVYGAAGQDPNAIADAVQKRLNQSLNQRGYAFR